MGSQYTVEVDVIKLSPEAVVPKRQSIGASAVDLCALEGSVIHPGQTGLVKTGLAMSIPCGMTGMVCSRSGLALKHKVFVLNAPGIIDSDYRGDVGVILHNLGDTDFVVDPGSRIAQLLILKHETAFFKEVNVLDETARGANGFGSTGKE
ncbi:dUTP diphosphatase [Castellaniella sp.]|uniref:dUTP diphosphatase n=1 Tax=Castellaniella sp. TaxID=1955812 RepID=UPI002B001A0F|nr:dUTP diphosphatase [Castellaniella sp.]